MKSPNARWAYAYGPPADGNARPRSAKTGASSTAPAPVSTQATSETGPAAAASDDGNRNTAEPIMLPTTRAVATQRPMVRRGGSAPAPLVFACSFMALAKTGQARVL